ncbi:cobalt transporter [Plantactinospora solaniradicis]|uniref:Nickel/cobalt efflux system n=1 Tax=Plantactinospora solaniradicis TaxID=1723736 RepID=A0ABW1KLF1_9ACTN
MSATAVIQAAAISDRLQSLVSAPGVPPLAFALAFLAGAGHAVAPGHGKSLAAAYLVGSRGRIRDAAWLGGSVAVMHTLSVLVIALAWTFLSLADVIRMPQLTTWLELVAGLLVVATGLWLVRRHLHAAAHPHRHAHPDQHSHSHGHDHDHDHGHPHSHAHDHGKRPGLVLLGISGGLTPSPAAFLVLVTGLFIGRAGFALLLVLTFGIGMAVVLFGVGLLAIAGNSVVVRGARSHALLRQATRVAPVLAAAGITVFGIGLTTVAAIHLTAVT